MGSPIAIDSPDGQRGVISAQKLLATVPSGTAVVSTGIPPNAETLIAVYPGTGLNITFECEGDTTGVLYPVRLARQGDGPSVSVFAFIDISSVLDSQVTITLTGASSSTWYVYADAAAHFSVDPDNYSDRRGVQYVVPTAPSSSTGDHPPVELRCSALNNQASGTVAINPPGAGQRLRIFYATCTPAGTSDLVALLDTITSNLFLTGGGTGQAVPVACDYKPSGLALSANAGVELATSAGNGSWTIVYTIETI
jgi:hypothetical protein